MRRRNALLTESFNPSIGMVFIRASILQRRPRLAVKFQSLNRDGVHSRICTGSRMKQVGGFNPSIGMVFIRAGLLTSF